MKQIKTKLIIFHFMIFLCIVAYGHTYKVQVIVDTDMAIDDARAITMLLNQDFIDLKLIVTSDGAVSPETGQKSLRSLLSFLKIEKVLIAAGRHLNKVPPAWRSWSKNIFSKGFKNINVSKNKHNLHEAPKEIVKLLNSENTKFIYLCLGPMTNLADALNIDPEIKQKISRVIYYGGQPDTENQGWNTKRDLISAKSVFKSGLKIYSLNSPDIRNIKFTPELLKKIKMIDTDSAKTIVHLFSDKKIKELLKNNHFNIWDEITIIYLSNPELFKFTRLKSNNYIIKKYDKKNIYQNYIKLLGLSADSHLHERNIVVLNNFPTNPLQFKPDIRKNVAKVINKYGLEEWKAVVLTNELHRHLGIYSIIGAKMGIYAREILGAPFDSVKVISHAGNKPPLSCMNDGLQVSTGASLGRGAIEVVNSGHQARIQFIYKNKKVIISIKQSILNKIKNDIALAIKKHDGLNKEYFQYIRKLSINYWFDLDRKKIFDIKTD